MKKKLLIIFSIIVLIIGCYFVFNEFKKKRLVNQAQEKAEEYLIENYEDVDTVHIDSENYHFDPMGGLSVGGYINNDEKLYFHALCTVHNNEVQKVTSLVKAHDFPDRKDEEKEKEDE